MKFLLIALLFLSSISLVFANNGVQWATSYETELEYYVPYFNTSYTMKIASDVPNNRLTIIYNPDDIDYKFEVYLQNGRRYENGWQNIDAINPNPKFVCNNMKSDGDFPSVLPVIDSKWEMTKTNNGTQKWSIRTDVNPEKTTLYEMYLTVKNGEFIPINYDMFGPNNLPGLGSHFDRYNVIYKSFSPTISNSSMFDLPSNCKNSIASISSPDSRGLISNVDSIKEFHEFQSKYNKWYNTPDELSTRFNTFLNNRHFVNNHNIQYEKGLHTFSTRLNHFADLSDKEFSRQYLSKRTNIELENQKSIPAINPDNIPDVVDWRKGGGPDAYVKDQDGCGSCWTFGSTGSIESALYQKYGKSVFLSEQQIVDCAWGYGGNAGCGGGYTFAAYNYLLDVGGITTESTYPYRAVNGRCHYSDDMGVAELISYSNITVNEPVRLRNALTHHSVEVSIDASRPSFKFYYQGIYTDPKCSTTDLDHSVLAVGYNFKAKSPAGHFWIVKNSWSTHWGDNGYVEFGGVYENNCGVMSRPISAANIFLRH